MISVEGNGTTTPLKLASSKTGRNFKPSTLADERASRHLGEKANPEEMAPINPLEESYSIRNLGVF